MQFRFIVLFLLINTAAFAQTRSLKGVVVIENTQTVLPGSSVFIASTSKGTIADNEGKFELNDVPAGKHELVISCIGYETVVFPFESSKLPLQLRVEMEVKSKELENVLLEPSVEESWDKWGNTFLKHFVGTSANAAHCRITNTKAIHFRYYKKSNRLIAYADEAIVLENKALGYKINYQLENFEINFAANTTTYLGYPYYQELEKGNARKWERNRSNAYQGSILHFMRSVYQNRLQEEGFEVRRMVRTLNEEKARVKKLAPPIKAVTNGTSRVEIFSNPDTPVNDSMEYYQRVLRQSDYTDRYGRNLLTADSILLPAQGDVKVIHFNDYLLVFFKNQLEEPGYAQSQMPPRIPGYRMSFVTLLNEQLIVVDASGNYYNPQEMMSSGYWGWGEKMANSLPLDYEEHQ